MARKTTEEKPAKDAAKRPAKPRTRGQQAEDDHVAAPGPARSMAGQDSGKDGEASDGYVDQDSEWEDARYGSEEHPTTKVFTDFTGGEKGISGKTDLTKAQFAFLWTLRNMQQDFEERGMHDVAGEIEEGSKWFETYRLSIDRKSRSESVDILRGRLEMMPKTEEQNSSPLRFN